MPNYINPYLPNKVKAVKPVKLQVPPGWGEAPQAQPPAGAWGNQYNDVYDLVDMIANLGVPINKGKPAPKKQAPLVINRAAKPYNEIEELVGENLFTYFHLYEKVGSKVICNPPPANADTDILVMIKGIQYAEFMQEAEKEGWKINDEYDGPVLVCQKNGVDLITTDKDYVFNGFKLAVKICKELNLLDKAQRIAVHNILLEGY